jgi:hypothetical protein
MQRTTIVLAVSSILSSILAVACDRAAEPAADATPKAASVGAPAKAEPAKGPAKAPAKADAKGEPAAIVLEEADLPGLGKLKLPKGFTSPHDKHWSFDLGNYESIAVSWEPHGAPSLEKAKTMSNILATAETVKGAQTLPNGYHEIERVRASDGFTFIALFGKDWYVKCVAPKEKIEI